ncbi:Tetratricopeptide repeat family, partial [Brachionus plicatilis]
MENKKKHSNIIINPLKIREKIFCNQPDHPHLATSFNNFGFVEKIYSNQPDHPDLATSLNNYGLVYDKIGKYEIALEYYNKSLKIREKIYSNQPDHLDLDSSFKNIGLWHVLLAKKFYKNQVLFMIYKQVICYGNDKINQKLSTTKKIQKHPTETSTVLIEFEFFNLNNYTKPYSKTSLRRWSTRRSPMLQQANNLDLLRWETVGSHL